MRINSIGPSPAERLMTMTTFALGCASDKHLAQPRKDDRNVSHATRGTCAKSVLVASITPPIDKRTRLAFPSASYRRDHRRRCPCVLLFFSPLSFSLFPLMTSDVNAPWHLRMQIYRSLSRRTIKLATSLPTCFDDNALHLFSLRFRRTNEVARRK